MKKHIKYILLILPLLFLVGFQSVKAVNNTSGIKYTHITKTGVEGMSFGSFGPSNFYTFTLDNEMALCLEHGKKLRSGLPYKYFSTVTPGGYANDMMIKAYTWAKANGANEVARLAAQVVAWAPQAGISGSDAEYLNAIKEALRVYSNITTPGTAEGMFEGIKNTDIGGITLYKWVYAGPDFGNYQQLLTSVKDEDDDTPVACKIETIGDIPHCDNYVQNSGLITQIGIGDCKDEYRTGMMSNIRGKIVANNSACGTFCISEFESTYPGHVVTPIEIGSHMVWPNSSRLYKHPATIINKSLVTYPLKTTLRKSCYVFINEDVVEKYKNPSDFVRNNNNRRKIYSGTSLSAADGCDGDPLTFSSRTVDFGDYSQNQSGAANCSAAYSSGISFTANVTRASQTLTCRQDWEKDRKQDWNTAKGNRETQDIVVAGKQNTKNTECSNYNSCVATYNSCVSQSLTNCITCSRDACTNAEKELKEAEDKLKRLQDIEKEALEKYNDAIQKRQKAEAYKTNATNMLSYCQNYVNNYNAADGLLKQINGCIESPNLGTGPGNTDYKITYQASYNDPKYSSGFSEVFAIDRIDSAKSELCMIDGQILDCGSLGNIMKQLVPPFGNVDPLSAGVSSQDIKNKADAIKIHEIRAETSYIYDLSQDPVKFKFVNKETNESRTDRGSWTNYSIIPYSNMPISYEYKKFKISDQNNQLKLTATGTDISDGEFTSRIAADYTCKYYVTKTNIDECICPTDSSHAGEDLYCKIKDTDETCEEGKIKYCYKAAETIPLDCPPVEDECTQKEYIDDYLICINAGGNSAYCKANFCNKKYICPNDSKYPGMDVSSCVIPMILKGYEEDDAYDNCKDLCSSGKGLDIIYRVIDLANPFPSIDAGNHTTKKFYTQKGDRKTVKGRYPGSNWNSVQTVKTKILENRGSDDEAVYQRTPLYTFVLDTESIKNIRSYNSGQNNNGGYSDFNLICNNINAKNEYKNASACRSTFIHNHAIGKKILTAGTCKNVSNSGSDFYTCLYTQ